MTSILNEEDSLPLEDINHYLVKILEWTDDEKQLISEECRKVLELLMLFRNRKKLSQIKYDDEEKIDEQFCESPVDPLENEKEIVSKIDAAIKQAKNVMETIENHVKSPRKAIKTVRKTEKDKTLCKDICPKSKRPEAGSLRGGMKQRSEVNRKCIKTKKEISHFTTTYKKDFITQNKNIKSVCSKSIMQLPLIPRNNISDGELFNFKGIDDILQRVTPYQSSKVKKDLTLSSNNSRGDMAERNDTLVPSSEIYKINDLSNFNYSHSASCKEIIKLFSDCNQLLFEFTNGNTRNEVYFSSFLNKLNKRNNCLAPNMEDEVENYNMSMKMMSKCSENKRKEYSSTLSIDFEDTLQTFFSSNKNFQQLQLKLHFLKYMTVQSELLDGLKKELSIPHQKQLNSTLFHKTCKTVLQFLPELYKDGG